MSGADPDPALLDAIYEASVAADEWPNVLDRIARAHRAQGAALFAREDAAVQWAASAPIRAAYEDFVTLGWHTQNVRVESGRALKHPGFITDTDMFTESEMAAIPIYRDYFIPRGLSAGSATFVDGLHDSELVLTLEGFASHTHARASLPSLDALRPHLARAAMLAARLQLERARVAAASLALVGTPAAILGRRRHVLAANELFGAKLTAFGHDTPRGLFLQDTLADGALGAALDRMRQPGGPGASLPLRLEAGPAVLHVLPMRGRARDLLAGATAVLILAAPGGRRAPSASLVAALLDLTPAEARLARELGLAGSISDAVSSLKISEATARTQLKSIFGKTGLRRQSDLLSLLASVTPPGTS